MLKARRIVGPIVACAAFVIAFVVVKNLKVAWFSSTPVSSTSMQEASEATAVRAQKEIKIAQDIATTNKTATEVLFDKARKQTIEALDNAKTDKAKAMTASNFFFGAYFVNTRTRGNYCEGLGVDIGAFANSYKEKHRVLFIVSERYQIEDFKDHGYKYDIDEFYKMMAPTLEQYVTQDMKDLASTLKISETEVCQSLNQNVADWVSAMDYGKRNPEVAQILLKQ